MDKQDVIRHLHAVGEAEREVNRAIRSYKADMDAVMKRLILEALRHRMSADIIAKCCGKTPRQIRALMRGYGLEPKNGLTMLASAAAEALHENAALLGVDPEGVDLLSPLAYLPMGKRLREDLKPKGVADKVLDAERIARQARVSGEDLPVVEQAIENLLTAGYQIVEPSAVKEASL